VIKITKWIDRKFNFDLPVGVFPWIVERLRGTPARIEELVKTIPPSLLTIKPDGKWSIQENIGHLIKVEELHNGRIDDYLTSKETLRPADMENHRTHDADYNNQNIADIIKSFRSVRINFVARLEQQDENIVARSSHHPRLNTPMRLIDMAHVAAEHDDYHMAVITHLSRNLNQQ